MAIGANWKDIWAEVWGPVWTLDPAVPHVPGVVSQMRFTGESGGMRVAASVSWAMRFRVEAGEQRFTVQ